MPTSACVRFRIDEGEIVFIPASEWGRVPRGGVGTVDPQ